VTRPSKAIARRPTPPGKRQASLPRTSRESAFEAIARHAARFPDLLPDDPRCDLLDARDAALARALYETTVRRWRTLGFLLDARLSRPMRSLEAPVQAALLVGGAQLLLMDKIPDHAAINESVEWVKRVVRPGAGKLVNAVLRRMVDIRGVREAGKWGDAEAERRDLLPLSGASMLVLSEPVLPEDPIRRLAIATGLPTWLVGRWLDRMGASGTRVQCLHTLSIAPVIVNASHATRPLARMEDWTLHAQTGFRVVAPGEDLGAALAGRSDVWVQDPGSALPVASLPEIAPKLVIDVCAGQGTKTRQLAHRFPDARIIASDADPARMETLKSLGATLANVDVCEASELAFRFPAAADLVLLDVPCTNTGVLARRLEARHRCSDRQLGRLVDAQRQIIADSIRLLAPRAHVLYSTCSLEPEECERQAAWTTKWHGLRKVSDGLSLPAGLPGQPPSQYRDGAAWTLLGGQAARHRTR
jgi:16S rRNA (cytosine967-C5)-methyltransferase